MDATKRIMLALILITVLAEVGGKLYCRYGDFYQQTVVCNSTSFHTSRVLTRLPGRGSVEVNTIILVGCALSDLNRELFYRFTNLRKLDISGNQLRNLQVGVFNKSTQLLYLDLSRNVLRGLSSGLFDHNVNLKFLNLEHNSLLTIDPGVFNPLKSLRNLNLMDNLLDDRSLNVNTFADNNEIATIRLSRNQIRLLPDNLFKGQSGLIFLGLENNHLVEIPACVTKANLITLNNLQLKRNEIESIEQSTTLVNLVNLNILDLSENMIRFISENVFSPLKKLQYLNLHGNKLQTLSSGMFNSMAMLSHLDLSNNMLTFIPDGCFVGTKLRILDVNTNRLTYMQNNFCTVLSNSDARLEAFYFNHNPWQCACLRDILEESKNLHIKYSKRNYRGREPVCVTTNRFICNRRLSDQAFYQHLFESTIYKNANNYL